MRLPTIQGLIRRRILANFRVDPEAVQRLIPARFTPKLHNGFAIAGICLIRLEEMRQSVRILHQCLDKLPGGPVNVSDGKVVLPPRERVLTRMEELIHHFINVTQGVNAPPGEVYFSAENPKGELGFYINSKGGGTPHRLKIRAPSFVNLSILPRLLPGHMVSDVTAILGSFDFVMGECDR